MDVLLTSLQKVVQINENQPFFHGGDAAMHMVNNHRGIILKLYKEPTVEREEKAHAMLANLPSSTSVGGGYAGFIWPRGSVYTADTSRRFLGIELPLLKAA